MIETINLEECDLTVQDFFAQLGDRHNVVICKDGKPYYFFGEVDEFQGEVLALSQNQEFMDYLDRSRQRGKREGTLSLAEVQRRLEQLEAAEQTTEQEN
ncbi:hypothetical protein PMG71_22690 [Roseofilum sp. BLCC_M154]|uniref:Prevent-host-death protein n=1 Tax=Roseofilum acuticapitatum BLCC-M154 TaxID=3022444 RepID=A0ABT7AZA4_9CYAN|nr:hypothetical protein [Roseofilum acuticapitatum]MDJ1172242.1 hypothetical protein [Roseofilum acuticapitatum BLCC-M154]